MAMAACASNFHTICRGDNCVSHFINLKGYKSLSLVPLKAVRNAVVALTAAGSLFIAVGQAGAQSPQPVSSDPAVVAKERQTTMKSMGDAMKKISAYVKSEGGTIEGV